jgi:NAD(P)-dependent dehydrogenase (short-subunit alcohol dehydrogenase family)
VNPVALVAGAGGAGAAVAVRLAAAGFDIVVLDSRAEAAESVAADVVSGGGAATAHGIDLLDVDAVVTLREAVLERSGRVDALVHLVGGWRGTKTLELASVENWNALHPPIVGTLATLTAVFGPDVKASPVGRVFMVTSTAAATPTAGNIAYASAKAAAEAWMTGVAHYLRDTDAASVIVAVKALLTDAMIANAEPGKEWPGYTHVRDLAEAIAVAATTPVENGSRLDLTAAGYSAS